MRRFLEYSGDHDYTPRLFIRVMQSDERDALKEAL